MSRAAHRELPRTDGYPHPRRRMMTVLRPPFRAAIERWWDVEVYGADLQPADGPLVVVGNHAGFLDGPLMATMGPRPVHALTKVEMFTGPLGAFLTGAGQIPLDRHYADPAAIKISLRVLREGGAVGVFPEGARGAGDLTVTKGGAAYLALATGAAVQPVIFLGTREPGGGLNSLPRRGSRMVLTYGEPITFDAHAWPRRKDEVFDATEQIGVALRSTMDRALAHTGLTLPGAIAPRTPRRKQNQ